MKNNKISSLELNYNEILLLFTLLVESLLHGQENRSRNKIVNLLKERITEFDKERMAIIEKFAEKDDKGELKTKDNQYVLTDKDGFQKEFNELVKSFEFIFDILPSNKADFAAVKKIILNSTKAFNFQDGEIYASICEKLEKI